MTAPGLPSNIIAAAFVRFLSLFLLKYSVTYSIGNYERRASCCKISFDGSFSMSKNMSKIRVGKNISQSVILGLSLASCPVFSYERK